MGELTPAVCNAGVLSLLLDASRSVAAAASDVLGLANALDSDLEDLPASVWALNFAVEGGGMEKLALSTSALVVSGSVYRAFLLSEAWLEAAER